MKILGITHLSTWNRVESIMKIMQDTSVIQTRQIQHSSSQKINDKGFVTEATGNLLNKLG